MKTFKEGLYDMLDSFGAVLALMLIVGFVVSGGGIGIVIEAFETDSLFLQILSLIFCIGGWIVMTISAFWSK